MGKLKSKQKEVGGIHFGHSINVVVKLHVATMYTINPKFQAFTMNFNHEFDLRFSVSNRRGVVA